MCQLCVVFKPIIELTPLLTTLLSVMVVVIGWWYNQVKNRKNEIAREARKNRIEMLQLYMSLVSYIEEKNALAGIQAPNEYGEQNNVIPEMAQWAKIQFQIKLYGKKDEIMLYDDIMSTVYSIITDDGFCISDNQFNLLSEKVKRLELICIESIRKELYLEY